MEDYIDKVMETYPNVNPEVIKKIVKRGWYIYYLYTLRGADVWTHHDFFGNTYCGKRFFNDRMRYLYSNLKKRVKLRILYKRQGFQFEGKYYFGLTDAEWEYYKKEMEKNKRYEEDTTFYNLRLYKIKEETYLDSSKRHYFIIDYPVDLGFAVKIGEISTRYVKHFADKDDDGNIVMI